MTEKRERELLKEYNEKLEALKKSFNNPVEIENLNTESLRFVEFGKSLEECFKRGEPATTLEDIQYRGFHYDY